MYHAFGLGAQNAVIVIARDFVDADLGTCAGELGAFGPCTAPQDAELLDFIGHLCKNPWLYKDKGVPNNALLQACLSFLCVYNLCRLALQENDGKLDDIYRNFDSFTSQSIYDEVNLLTPVVIRDSGETRACETYYSGRSKLQRGVEVLQLDRHARTLKNIGTFDAKAARYHKAMQYIVETVTEAQGYVGPRTPAFTEFESFMDDYDRMSIFIITRANAFNGFNALYNSTIVLLRMADADPDAIVQSNQANFTAEVPNLRNMYNLKKQRLIWTTLYYRVTQEFYKETPALAAPGVGLDHSRFDPTYYANAASITDVGMLAVLETIRTDPGTIRWRINSPMPVIRLFQTIASVIADVQAAFPPPGGVDPVAEAPLLLSFMAGCAIMRDAFRRTGLNAVTEPGLEAFDLDNPTKMFSLNAALGDVEGAGASGDGLALGGIAAPKAGAGVKAVAKRAKKIRFELDDAQFPTIAEDAV